MTITYFDSGIGGPKDCLGAILDREVARTVRAFRGQFGFFDISALRKYLPILQNAVDAGGAFRLVIGANNGDPASTTDLNALLPIVSGGGDAKLAIVGFSNALFHPKTLHIVRDDQSAVGIVGSANMTSKGLGHNVEAGIIIESSDANEQALNSIATAIDYWFKCNDPGVYKITEVDDIRRLEELGLIVSPSTRRRLRRANRTHGAVTGRGPRTMGWSPPGAQSELGKPTEVEGDGPAEIEASELQRERTAITARWCKRLRRSDAQQVQPGTNPTGKLRLARASFNIDQTTYFREEFFGDEHWIQVDRRGTIYEEVHINFVVERSGHAPVPVTLRVDHASHRVANQNNVATVLGWGREVGQWLHDNDQTNNWVVLEKSIDGQYWMSFQTERPDWAP